MPSLCKTGRGRVFTVMHSEVGGGGVGGGKGLRDKALHGEASSHFV